MSLSWMTFGWLSFVSCFTFTHNVMGPLGSSKPKFSLTGSGTSNTRMDLRLFDQPHLGLGLIIWYILDQFSSFENVLYMVCWRGFPMVRPGSNLNPRQRPPITQWAGKIFWHLGGAIACYNLTSLWLCLQSLKKVYRSSPSTCFSSTCKVHI